MSYFRKKTFLLKSSLIERFFFQSGSQNQNQQYFLTIMIMKVVKQILARADVTETTPWLSVKKRKRGVFIMF